MARLYQFAGSHFCEKARWALDHKRMAYEATNLVPGPHRRVARRLGCASSLPILVDDNSVVQGSPAIIDYLDKTIRTRPLTPTHTQDASMAREWERYLDRNIGINLRLCFCFHAFRQRRFVTDFLLRGAPGWGRVYFAFAYPAIRRGMQDAMSVNAANEERARVQLMHAVDRIDERITAHGFLAGPHFSRADLTAAALLFHQWVPGWETPPGLESLYETLSARPFYAWAKTIYANHRSA